MNINRNNYEIYFMDYLDGNLSEEDKKSVDQFLDQHPDLKKEFNNLRDYTHDQTIDDQVAYDDKDGLKKSASDLIPSRFENEDEFLIAKVEGDLDLEEEALFERYLKLNPEKKNDLSLFRMTVLEADESIRFENKAHLKKKAAPVIGSAFYRYVVPLAVAAILVVMFLFVNEGTFKQEDDVLSHKIEQGSDTIKSSEKVKEKSPVKEIETATTIDNKDKPSKTENKPEKKQSKSNKKYNRNNRIEKVVISIADNSLTDKSEDPLVRNVDTPVQKVDVKKLENEQLASKLDESYNYELTEYNAWIDLPQNGTSKNSDMAVSKQNGPRTYTLGQYAALKFKERFLDEENPDPQLNLWDVADAGVRGFANIVERDIYLEREYDESGNMISLAFNSPNLAFNAPLRRNR